jgi:hypothetical protein
MEELCHLVFLTFSWLFFRIIIISFIDNNWSYSVDSLNYEKKIKEGVYILVVILIHTSFFLTFNIYWSTTLTTTDNC